MLLFFQFEAWDVLCGNSWMSTLILVYYPLLTEGRLIELVCCLVLLLFRSLTLLIFSLQCSRFLFRINALLRFQILSNGQLFSSKENQWDKDSEKHSCNVFVLNKMTIQYLHLFGMIPTSVSAPLGKTLCALHDPIVPPFIVSSTWKTSPLLNDSSSSSDPRYWNWALNTANHLTRIRYR